jgi:hypothetical protein
MNKNHFSGYHKKLKNLIDEYKNKPTDKDYDIRLGRIIFDCIHDNKDMPMYKMLYDAPMKTRYKVFQGLLNANWK